MFNKLVLSILISFNLFAKNQHLSNNNEFNMNEEFEFYANRLNISLNQLVLIYYGYKNNETIKIIKFKKGVFKCSVILRTASPDLNNYIDQGIKSIVFVGKIERQDKCLQNFNYNNSSCINIYIIGNTYINANNPNYKLKNGKVTKVKQDSNNKWNGFK